MSQTEGSERILAKMVAWGTARDDLRAIAVVGSRARADHPADPWSDLDVIVMARRPKRYLTGTGWLAQIETPWLAVRVPTVTGGQQIFHVTFDGGTKVDLVVVSSVAFSLAGRAMESLSRHPSLLTILPKIARDRLTTLSDLLNRGFRFVLDKDRIAVRLESGGLAVPPPSPPSHEEFLDLVRCFLTEQVSFALKMCRGEFFLAKTLGESRLMDLLLQMIEWHTQVTSDRWSPVFERGRFLEEWAPPIVIERLREIFPHYDPAEIWQARLEALDLFRQLAQETGARLGYSYPTQLEETVMTWVRGQAPDWEGGRPTSGRGSQLNARPVGRRGMPGSDVTGLCVPYTVRVTPDRGRGVFADAAIRKGAIVWRHVPGQYAVYDESSLNELLARMSRSEAVYELTHMFGVPEFPGYMIRVLDDGVLINHSRQPTTVMNHGSRENEVPYVNSAQGVADALLKDRFSMIATRNLEVGEELTHDYTIGLEDPPYYDALCEHYEVSWSWL